MSSERRLLRRRARVVSGSQSVHDDDNSFQDGRCSDDPYADGRRSLSTPVRLVLMISGGVLCAYGMWLAFGTDAIVGILTECWPIPLAVLLGISFGRMAARELYSPVGRLLVQLDVEHHMFRTVFVPERMFRYLDQTGNNVVYHTPSGMPVYLVEDMDLAKGFVDYGWVHENNAVDVMTHEGAYIRWHDTLDSILKENLQLIANPKVLGLGYARGMLRRHLDDIGKAVGLDVPDYDHLPTFDDGSDPEQNADGSLVDSDGSEIIPDRDSVGRSQDTQSNGRYGSSDRYRGGDRGRGSEGGVRRD